MVRHPRHSNGCHAQYIFNNVAGNADAACLWLQCNYQLKLLLIGITCASTNKISYIIIMNEKNAKRIPHMYQIGDKIMLKNTTSTSMVVLSTKAHTQSQWLMIMVLYVSNGVSSMTLSTSEISSLTISEKYVP